MILKRETIVDSTIIAAHKEKKRDPQAHSVKKGNTWHFGYKAHVGVDSKTGLVHTVKTTVANVHDVTVMPDLLTGKETIKSRAISGKKIEHQKPSIRAKVEHVFGVVKKLFKYRKMRYRGIVKQTQKINIMFALANLYMANKKIKLALIKFAIMT